MNCLSENQIIEFIYGEFPPVEKGRIEKHIQTCETCRTIYAKYTDFKNLMNILPEEVPDKDVFHKLLCEVKPKRDLKRKFNMLSVIKAVTGFIIFFIVACLLNRSIDLFTLVPVLNKSVILQTIGNFGLFVLLLMVSTVFFMLAMAPVLYLETHEIFSHSYKMVKNKQCYKIKKND